MEAIENAYEAPAITVVEVKIEGVICQSIEGMGGSRKGYGEAIEDEWI